MNFVSFTFVVFFALTLIGFLWIPERHRKLWLLLASYVFYATWSIPFIAVILASTTVDYWMSKRIERSTSDKEKKQALWFGIIFNLAILGFFKYAVFLTYSYYGMAHWLGISNADPPLLHIILPLGISFYTFEALSYLIDVYRGKTAAPNWLDYNFYIMYFPHLISGPIIRFTELYPQYAQPIQLPGAARLAKGLELVVLGFAFKVLIADQAAMLVNPIFANVPAMTPLSAWLGLMGFSVQIYFDFMGYTHIARGISLFFNIEMPVNFNHPYLAGNITQFWQNWHMTLSRWIRDYLFIPLGGSRVSLGRSLFNLVLVMTIAGAWHGAGWTYIVWGFYQGVMLVINKVYDMAKPGWLRAWGNHPVYIATMIWLTFCATNFGWIMFRSTDFGMVNHIVPKFLNIPGLLSELGGVLNSSHLQPVVLFVALPFICFSGPWWVRLRERAFDPLPTWSRLAATCLLLIACWIFSGEATQPFIYFQF